ncbi:hypothetical protein BJV77DRAFT_1015618, partial [Russula vinacea]
MSRVPVSVRALACTHALAHALARTPGHTLACTPGHVACALARALPTRLPTGPHPICTCVWVRVWVWVWVGDLCVLTGEGEVG